jgi:hypothetical protein
MALFTLKAGSIPGRDHLFRQANCQDRYRCASFEQNGQLYRAGVVCDGCGSAEASEVGAALLAEFVFGDIARLAGEGLALADFAPRLYRDSLDFLARLAGLVTGEKESARFVERYLLATLLGFVAGEEETLVFAAGDGFIIINDEIECRDEDNRPHYPAYDLLDPAQYPDLPPRRESFDCRLLPTAEVARLAVWTDGFDPALKEEIWDLAGPRGLQRKLNVWSKRKLFADDTTGITLERAGQVNR